MTISKVSTIANPEKIAPATKYGGNMVVCHPGITDVAKSKDTMVCTESTSGVAKPASTRETVSYLDQAFAAPTHPKLKAPYTAFDILLVARSLIVAKSGIRPMYQKTQSTPQ